MFAIVFSTRDTGVSVKERIKYGISFYFPDQTVTKSKRRRRKVRSKQSHHKRARLDQDEEQVVDGTEEESETVHQVDTQYHDTSDILEAPEIEIDQDVVPNEDFENEYRELEEARSDKSDTEKHSKAAYRYVCLYCKQYFKTPGSLNLHTTTTHGVTAKDSFLCRHCFKQFVFQHELDLHKTFCCKRMRRNFECPMCGLKFPSSSEMDEHPCSGDHARPYFCAVEDCRYTCKSLRGVREHCKRHLGIKPYLCNVCGCAYSTKTDMDRHADSHKDSQDVVCKYCGKTYKSRHSLHKHLVTHEHKDRFKCGLCSFATAYQNDLHQHSLKHSQRKHKCRQCNKSLRSAASLLKHMDNIHSTNKIFSCKFCDFTTTVGKKFSGHMLKHRKEKYSDDSDGEDQMLTLDLSAQSLLQSPDLTPYKPLTQPQLVSPPLLPEHTVIRVTPLQSGAGGRSGRSTHIPTLTEATLAESEEVEISGQGADTLMSNIVASSYSDISITQDAGNPTLSFYVTDITGSDSMVTGPSTISMPSLMITDSISSMTDGDAWCSTDQT